MEYENRFLSGGICREKIGPTLSVRVMSSGARDPPPRLSATDFISRSLSIFFLLNIPPLTEKRSIRLVSFSRI